MDRCSWCGADVEPGDGWRVAEPAGERIATFCRLEHIVPWTINGAHWEAGTLAGASQFAESLTECAHCAVPLPDRFVLAVRHRGEHRIPDAFCSAGHLADWAKRGGRWQ